MLPLDKSRLEIKLGAYSTAPATALTDPTLLPRVQAYRRGLGNRMIALDRHGAKSKIPGGEFFVSRKIDGEFNALLFTDGEALLVNPGGTVRVGLQLLDEAAAALKKAGVKSALIAGELYVRRPDGQRARVHDVSRVARKPASAEEVGQLAFAVFDLIEIDGDEIPVSPFSETWKRIGEFFGTGDRVTPVETIFSSGGAKGVLDAFEKWIEAEGGEGVVARSDDGGWFKVKPRHTIDCAVIGFAEGTDDRAGLLHDLLLGIARTDGSWQVLGRVGGGFSEDDRRAFLSDLRDIVTGSDYAEVNSDRVAYEMVRPEWVVEISCLDFITQTTRGASIDRMVLTWDAATATWRTAGRLPLCSIISPQFVRRREDKTPNPHDCRLAQLTDLIEIPRAEASASDLRLPASEVLHREVRVKELKGKTMVRKLLLWKTNKENAARGDYPAYVLHLTDFSPNRKEPLQREIRVSDSLQQIETFRAQFEEKYFVGGWKVP
jgi:hypothetical protein